MRARLRACHAPPYPRQIHLDVLVANSLMCARTKNNQIDADFLGGPHAQRARQEGPVPGPPFASLRFRILY
jgi:hypothetical protein